MSTLAKGDTPVVLRGVSILSDGPEDRSTVRVDLTVQRGRITAIDDPPRAQPSTARGSGDIDADGLLCLPGLVDMHVHLREPGQTHKETLRSGTQAAARGGFTFVACMPNTRPVLDSADVLRELHARIRADACVRVGIVAAITMGSQGDQLTDFVALKGAGAIALSDDGRGIQRASVMRLALQRAGEVGLPIFAHCEDESLSQGGVLHEGPTAVDRCLVGIPAESESAHVARDILLAEQTRAHYHVCHISCAQSLRLVREAKARGQSVTCEVTPHHLLLCDQDVRGDDANFKMNPPLRSPMDRAALLAGLGDGTIDAIATDHAPHTPAEKARGLALAPFGVIGLETAFPLLYTHLVERDHLSLARLVHLLSTGPAHLLRQPAPSLRIGGPANLTLVDLQTTRSIDEGELRSKSRNTPFLLQRVRGWPVCTIADGRVVFSELGQLPVADL